MKNEARRTGAYESLIHGVTRGFGSALTDGRSHIEFVHGGCRGSSGSPT